MQLPSLGFAFSDLIAPLRTNLSERLQKFEKNTAETKRTTRKKLTVFLIYICFLLAYSFISISGRNNESIYFAQRRLKALFDPRRVYYHQHNMNSKSFINDYHSRNAMDHDSANSVPLGVLTVRDLYLYLNNTFLQAVYGTLTFDGDPRVDKPAHNRTDLGPNYRSVVNRRGFVGGQNMLLGGVRIGQAKRRFENDCNFDDKIPDNFLENYDPTLDVESDRRFFCYGYALDHDNINFAPAARFCDENPSKYDFDNPLKDGCMGPSYDKPFTYTEIEPEYRLDDGGFGLIQNLTYTSKGYFETLPHSNLTLAAQKIFSLYDNGFIDYQTRAIFLDLPYWNQNLNIVMVLRIEFVLPLEGTIFAKVGVFVADYFRCTPFDLDSCHARDFIKLSIELLCFMLVFLVMILTLVRTCVWTHKVAAWHYGLQIREQRILRKRSPANSPSQRSNDSKAHNYKLEDDEENGHRSPSSKSGTTKRGTAVHEKRNAALKFSRLSSLWSKIWESFKHTPSSLLFWNIFLMLQLSLFFSFITARLIAYSLVPREFDIAGDDFIDFRTSILWFSKADSLNALFIFFSWLRLFEVISFFTSYSWRWLILLLVTFFIGSAVAMELAFGFYVYGYRTTGVSFITTLRGLLGEIPFHDLEQILDSETFGFIFALLYCMILVGIFVHVVIAIVIHVVKFMKKQLQVDLEYSLESRRDKFRMAEYEMEADTLRMSFIGDKDDLSDSDESSLSSLDTTDHAILDHRRRKRRATRRAKQKAFVETIADYVDSDPVLGTLKKPRDTDSLPSLGDIVELDATGDVDRHYSFFYPYTPKFSCKLGGRKFEYDPKKCCLCCAKSRGEKDENIINEDDSSSSEEMNGDHPPSILRNSVEMKPLSSKRVLVQEFGNNWNGANLCSVEDILQGIEDSLGSSIGAYGSALKAVALFKLFGFDSPSQAAEALVASIAIKEAHSNIYNEPINNDVQIAISEAQIHELDPVMRLSHRKVLHYVKELALMRVKLFMDIAVPSSSVFNVDAKSALFAISRLVNLIDIRNGQFHLDDAFETFEELGISMHQSSKKCIQCLFGQHEISKTRSITRQESGAEYSYIPVAPLTYDTSFSKHYTSMEALPMVFLATLSLSSDNTRSHFAMLLNDKGKQSDEEFHSIISELTQHVYKILLCIDNGELYSAPSFLVAELDIMLLLFDALQSSTLRNDWTRKAREVSIKAIDLKILDKSIPSSITGSNRTKLVGAFRKYGETLGILLNDPRSSLFDAIYFQHCLERDLAEVWGESSMIRVRQKMHEFLIHTPYDATDIIHKEATIESNPCNTEVAPKGLINKFKRFGSRQQHIREVDEFLHAVMTNE